MGNKCEICGRELDEKTARFLRNEIVVTALDNKTELDFLMEFGECCRIYDFIGSCFYCDSRRLTREENMMITP